MGRKKKSNQISSHPSRHYGERERERNNWGRVGDGRFLELNSAFHKQNFSLFAIRVTLQAATSFIGTIHGSIAHMRLSKRLLIIWHVEFLFEFILF